MTLCLLNGTPRPPTPTPGVGAAPAVQRIMAETGVQGRQLDAVVTGVGPGPFTGLRVGLVLAHSMAAAWAVPLHGVCSLDALALRAVEADVEGDFIAVTDARRREVYWAHYTNDDGDSGLVEGPFVDQAAACPELPAVGAGVGLYADQLYGGLGGEQHVVAARPRTGTAGRGCAHR